MCEADTQRSPLKKGTLKKRPRGQKSNGMAPPKISNFQKRFFVLTEETFEYFKPGKRSRKKTPLGSLMVENIRAVEVVKSGTFDSEHDRYCFQVNCKPPDKDGVEYLYLQASSENDMDGWISTLRQAAEMKGNPMLSHYHFGAYRFWKWTCCKETDFGAGGCTPSTNYSGEESGFEDSLVSSGSYDVGTMKDPETRDRDTPTRDGGTLTRDQDTLTKGLELTASVSSTSTLTPETLSPDLKHSSLYTLTSLSSMGTPEIDSGQFMDMITDSAGASDPRYHARDTSYVQLILLPDQNTQFKASKDSGLGGSHFSLRSNSTVSNVETSRDKSASFGVSLSPPRPSSFDQSQGTNPLSKSHKQIAAAVSVPVHLEPLMENGTADTQKLEMKKHFKEEQPARTIRAAESPIRLCVFVSQETIAYVPGSYKLIIYSTAKGKVLYDVEFTYRVASLDVWENYILVGSCPVQLFRLEEKRLQRTVVVDPEDDLTIEGTSAYLAAFLPGGYFATARRAGNKIVIWPPPTKDNSLISETHKRITVRNASNKISSLRVSGDCEHPVLVVESENLKSKVLDVFDCSNYETITPLQTPINDIYSPLKEHERKDIQRNYASVEAVGRCQSSLEQKPVALSNGLIILYNSKKAAEPTLFSFSSEKILEKSSLVCMNGEGSTVVAAGFENGDIELWGGNLMKKVAEDSIDEIQRLNVFLGDSFYQESMFYHEYEFTVDHLGGKFTSYPSYSLEIPKGAVRNGELIIRTGILKYGVFWPSRSPDNIEIISPIVFFLSNDPNMVFEIPAMLELQHCCVGEAQGSLVLLKADHRNFTLEVVDDALVLASNEHRNMYSTEIRHFCVFCFGIKKNEDGVKAGYTLIPIERKGYVDNTHEVNFCLTYNLETCNDAVRKQYIQDDYTIWPSLEVIFSGPPISIEHTNTDLNGWLIADKSPKRQVSVEDMNWEERFKNQTELFLAQERKRYPPRFILECCGTDVTKGITLNVRLTNVEKAVSYDINLYKPATMEQGEPDISIYPAEDLQKEKSLSLSSCPSFHRFCGNGGSSD